MRKFGLIGFPLGHSFSSEYFTQKFERENISGCLYANFPIENIGMLPDLVNSEPDLEGLNVTIPYKTVVIGYLDEIDPEAAAIGAVNVVKIHRRGGRVRLAGYNSDIKGISDSIASFLACPSCEVLVLGTGGASKAVCHVLRKAGLFYYLVSRRRGEGIISYDDISSELIDRVSLIINTTPLGMYPDTERFPDLDYSLLSPRHALFDLVYNPEITTFLSKGKERGCGIITGLKMLKSQAERSWEIWNSDDVSQPGTAV